MVAFTLTTKMADVILTDYRLLNLLPRFDMRLGFGEKTLTEVCDKHNVNARFFLLICNIQASDNYPVTQDDMDGLDLRSMIGYLKKSHDYYLNNRIALIEHKLDSLASCHIGAQHQIICKFFAHYKQEVVNHFLYEEKTAFPNIEAIGRGEKVSFHIDVYEKNHDNIDEKLSDLKNIIIKYLPECCSVDELNDVLIDIFLLEEDLMKHTRIEDKILIPFVKQIERGNE